GRAELLAGAGVEAGFRLGCSALGFHGHSHLADFAYAPRPYRRAAGLRRPPSHDEDGTADDLPARGWRGRRTPAAHDYATARSRSNDLRPSRLGARPGSGTVARSRAHS